MDKFILGENPMRPDDHGVYIIHLLNPVAIIAATDSFTLFKRNTDTIFKNYQYRNSDGVIEEWTLIVHHFMTTDFLTEPNEQAVPLLDKAWRWYRSYMEWEDKY